MNRDGKNTAMEKWFTKRFIYEKLNNPIGYAIIILIALFTGLVFSVLSLKSLIFILGLLIGIPVIVYAFVNLKFGLSLALVLAFLIELFNKYTQFPVGTALDGLLALLLISVLVRLVKEKDYSFAKSPISLMVTLWIYYNLLQVLNPWAGSQLAWLYTVRTVAIFLSIYFVAAYSFKSLKDIKYIIKFILFLTFISALYSLKQEYLGFSPTEIAWVHESEERFIVIFQWTRLRVFSFFSDPTSFGILMGYMSVFCIILFTGPYALWKKALLIIITISMLMAMAYAGSRTPVVLIPFGVIFYVIMTLNKNVIIASGIFFLLGTAFVMKSTSNPVIYRIQSAFHLKKDASVEVRLKNQERIQPFIHKHPVGAGLGSTGLWAKRFTPESWLAGFAHDSGYVRIAVEAGWIGLVLYMVMLFVIFRTGVKYYFLVKNPEIKNLYLGLTSNIFLLSIASYPQEAIILLPTSIIFYISLGAMVRLKDFDD